LALLHVNNTNAIDISFYQNYISPYSLTHALIIPNHPPSLCPFNEEGAACKIKPARAQ